MNLGTEHAAESAELPDGLFTLALLSLLAGTAAGLIGAVFRLLLDQADRLRDALIAWANGEMLMGSLLVIATCAGATGVAAWLVRRFSPQAEGSGIPHVEAVLHGELPPAPYRLIPVKFFGGLLAIGSGLALGREGPSVQMGATIAHLLGKLFHRNDDDCKVLLAAGAGAGLATAFNAPIGGAVFVLEELVRRFDTRTTIVTLGASAGAIAVARVFLGDAPDFHVEPLPYPGFGTVPIHLALGIVAGCAGVAYNRAILGTIAVADRLHRWPVELRAALVGAAVALLAWFAPGLVGGGDAITQRTLSGTETVAILSVVFLLRFGLGPLSYAAGTPGGLFAPILVLGSQSGLLFGNICYQWYPDVAANPTALGIVGMAAFFTAVVRAPVTGIVLVTEMTASFTLLLPMLSACFTAMLVPNLLRDAPIYDSLRERTLARSRMK
ncbi:MAG TPA: H(+)/Cl(-) exchange transporter ClcA [Candidatus Binatia bacterium]|nr:H(+)/Cl(-) exchange transporter ClcA [Candidatus Binatia bacterium]